MLSVSVNLIMVIISQHIQVSNHHVIHFEYIMILFVNYTSVKIKKQLIIGDRGQASGCLWEGGQEGGVVVMVTSGASGVLLCFLI